LTRGFNPPSDRTDPSTARAPVDPRRAPAIADPMDVTGTDPYSDTLNAASPTGGPSFKQGGLVRRGYGRARGA
jgi:hypothetical protein